MLHGGQLKEAKIQFPHVAQGWIDLSTGINPYAYPFSPMTPDRSTQLPSIEDEHRLRGLAALRYGVRDQHLIAVAPGTQILISLMPYILNAKQVCVFCPTYMEHIKTWQQTTVSVHQVVTLDDFMRFSTQEQTIGIICNPNNPDGRLFNVQQMQTIIHQWGSFHNHVVVDEAFMDFEGQTIASLLPHPALTILRSFGKTYGLAGVRLGFLLSNASYVEKLRKMLGPWPISGSALHVGLQALRNREWILKVKDQLSKQIKQFDQLFLYNACKVVGGTHLFRLIEMQEAHNLWKYLANHGIWVRKFDYNPQWLRFGLPQEQDWGRIEKTIQDYFEDC